MVKPGAKGTGKLFSSFEEAKLVHEWGFIELGAQITVQNEQSGKIETTVGRVLFNEILPPELRDYDKTMDKASLK